MTRFRNSLKLKVGFYLVIALMIAVIVFTIMVVRNGRDVLLQQAVSHNAQLSGVLLKGTRFAMLQNEPSHISQIINDVGAQEDIEKVRILSKNGTIMFSTKAGEIGTLIDQEAESCEACHLDINARKQSPPVGRPRFFTDQSGRRMLGSTAVIHNEPSCSNSDCHAHPKDQTVLGVLDIVYPLEGIYQDLRSNTYKIISLSLGFVLLAAFLMSLLVHRVVYVPLRDLKDGAERLARDELESPIPVRSKDEFGQVAASFNSMTEALHRNRMRLRNWGETLEKRVEEATHELHLAQAETARSEKLASVGLLAAGIAHELNNPLTGVLTFSYLVRKNMPDDSPEAEDLDLVIRETKRCAAIIKRLLDFAREKTPEKKFSNPNKLVEEAAQLIEQPAQINDIEIRMELDEQLPILWIDEDLVKQVIMNMLVNAQHAIGIEGRITLRTRVVENYHGSEPGNWPAPMVEISVTDTGSGIPEDDLQRIFDPFFTTKSVGMGTGLGLSVSHGTVQAHGGEIEVESTVGEGSVFRVYLPVGGTGEPDNTGEV